MQLLKRNTAGQQLLLKTLSKSSEETTKISFLIAEVIAMRGKPLSEGEFVKDCLSMFTSVACPDKTSVVEKISLSHQTVARRVDFKATFSWI